MRRFSIPRILLTGILAILPLVVTVAVVIWVAGFLGELVGPKAVLGRLLEDVGLRLAGSKTFAYLTGWIVVLGIIFGVGLLVEFGAKRLLQDSLDGLAKRIPLLGGVYGTVRQFASMMERKPDADLHVQPRFPIVVLIPLHVCCGVRYNGAARPTGLCLHSGSR
jgi:uncharacterized membrane protein